MKSFIKKSIKSPTKSFEYKVSRLYQLLTRGGFEYREIIDKEGLIKSLKKEDLSKIVNKEVNKSLLHELAIHGLLKDIDPGLLDEKNLLAQDNNWQSPLSNAIRYKCLEQIPKKFITKEVLSLDSRKTTLLHIATWAGQLNHIEVDKLDCHNLCSKDFEDETPLGSVMEMIDSLDALNPLNPKSSHHGHYTSLEVIENYKKLLPILLRKINLKSLNDYKKYCLEKDLPKSLSFINQEIAKKKIESLSQKNNLVLNI